MISFLIKYETPFGRAPLMLRSKSTARKVVKIVLTQTKARSLASSSGAVLGASGAAIGLSTDALIQLV